MTTKKPHLPRWAVEFKRLNQYQSDSAIQVALDWVVKNVNRIKRREHGLPPVFSPSSFRNCFQWINDAIQKEDRDKPKPVSTKAKVIARRLATTMTWPKGSKAQLPAVVETSLVNARRFLKKLRRFEHPPDWGSSRCFQVDKLKARIEVKFSGGVSTFVERWFTYVHKRVASWNDWSGNLNYFAFVSTHKDFDRMGQEVAIEFAGTGGIALWRLLREEVCRGVGKG